jgi:hypothetical protein
MTAFNPGQSPPPVKTASLFFAWLIAYLAF